MAVLEDRRDTPSDPDTLVQKEPAARVLQIPGLEVVPKSQHLGLILHG